MENKLRKLFDYQRFEGNARLAKMIREAEEQASAELSDDELFMVNAAGEIGAKSASAALNEHDESDKQ